MRMKAVAGAVAAVAILAWVQTSNGQVFPAPTAGSGIVQVTGKVDVANVVPVDAAQRGEWRVSVSNTPAVSAVPFAFLKAGATYGVTWADGAQENVRVLQLGGAGWARVEHQTRRRWVNLELARAIDEPP
jgi:hypothetical protein